ncbi:MAG TPA: hypothetical protein DCO86_04850 [Spirochaetaceae bacterium]|nr:hypothetical protein [Spirochaetaceae bacterium]
MDIYSVLYKTKSGILMKVETAKRGGFPRFDIYYKNGFFNPKECEAKIKNAAVVRKLQYPKGVTISLITPQGNISSCGNIELAIAVSVLCKSQCNGKIIIASSINSKGECVTSDIIPSSLIEICLRHGIEDIMLSENARKTMESEIAKNPEGYAGKIKMHYVGDIADAYLSFARIESRRSHEKGTRNNDDYADSCNAESLGSVFHIAKSIPDGKAKNNDKLLTGIIGMENCKKVISIALAGRHNLLILGPKGSGKSLIMDVLSRIALPLPEKVRLAREENMMILKANETNPEASSLSNDGCDKTVFKVFDEKSIKDAFKTQKEGIPRIIAENGSILLVDDISELSRKTMMLLKSCISKSAFAFKGESYPLSTSIIAASRLCGCGKLGRSDDSCECSASSRKSFNRNLNEIIYDNFDMICCISEDQSGQANAALRMDEPDDPVQMIVKALQMQSARYESSQSIAFNSDILKTSEADFRSKAIEKAAEIFNGNTNIGKSLKAYCIARTLADCKGKEDIDKNDAKLAIMLSDTANEHF